MDVSASYQMALACFVVALLYAIVSARHMLDASSGTEKMRDVANAIKQGAQAYFKRQYRTIAIVSIAIAALLAWQLGWLIAVSFLLGGTLSSLASFITMRVSISANIRTTEAARTSLNKAVTLATRAASIGGILTVGLSLLGITLLTLYLQQHHENTRTFTTALLAFGFGASLISIFVRLGGGIFNTAADVGADLVGKIEAGIPEDDIRNPAVVADNVGDNVGDCSGMAADLFETYAVTLTATLSLAAIYFSGRAEMAFIEYPLAVSAICILTSILGVLLVRPSANGQIMRSFYRGLLATSIFTAAALYILTNHIFGLHRMFGLSESDAFSGMDMYFCTLIGLAASNLIVWITAFYTSADYRPVRSIAKAAVTGHAGTIIRGMGVSMEATLLPTLVICAGILGAYYLAGLLGIAMAATSMISLSGFMLTLNSFGPITDNAGGISEMASLPDEVRATTDQLDAAGNVSKAIVKGYAIASTAMAALVLFTLYAEDVTHYFGPENTYDNPVLDISFQLNDPYILIGLLVGGALPYCFSALSMMAVGRAASAIVLEVRRQLSQTTGIMDGSAKPDYGQCVDMLTQKSIKAMIIPSLLPVIVPVALYGAVDYLAGQSAALSSLGALLIGIIITGLFLAIAMTTGGGAWDNAKKYIEQGHYGGKGSDAHKAAVTGDTVGDPYKDTTGPAINPLIKIANLVAILLLALLA